MINHLRVPGRLDRNEPKVSALGPENTGQELIALATQRVGRQDLADADILDVGCGVRFTQTIVNRRIPIGSYTGIEVHRPTVRFLKKAVERRDDRFRFVHWDAYNALYNPRGSVRLQELDRLPVDGTYDLIWLFSVFTHLDPSDARAMLRILRHHVRPEGRLFFSAFIDPDLDGFEDREPRRPLLNAYFGRRTMDRLLAVNGWRVDGFHAWDHERPIVDHFVCSPVDTATS